MVLSQVRTSEAPETPKPREGPILNSKGGDKRYRETCLRTCFWRHVHSATKH